MKKSCLVVLLLAPVLVSANASWNGVLKNVEVNPRINVVHLDTLNSNTHYYFLAAIPMVVFHYGYDVFSSLLITDEVSDQTVVYLLEDWEAYLNQHSSSTRHANFIGSVSQAVQNEIKTRFGIADEDVDTIGGTPMQVANHIAKKDWKHSDWVVIGPYKTTLTDHDIESLSNAAVIASLLNAPVLFTDLNSISETTLLTISKLGADKAVLVEVDDVLSDEINFQLGSVGVTVVEDLTTIPQVVGSIRNKASRSTLCGIINRWQSLAASLSGARYGGYVLFLPDSVNKLANDLYQEILEDPELQSFYKLAESLHEKGWLQLSEQEIAQNFYAWLTTVGGNDPDSLETVITFEPQGTGGGSLETTFERAISGDPSNLTKQGAIPGRMPLNWFRNIALVNRTGMYRAMIFANPRPYHVTLAMNAYEVRHTPDTGSPIPDSWGTNHIVNELFGWPYRGWCAENSYFPWDDIHSNAPDLSPILPPGDGDGADHDPGQFASFLSGGYEAHFHSGAYAGTGSHPAQPDVSNIGFVEDANSGSAFLYFSCHGGGTSIAVRNSDNGVAVDPGAPGWGEPYWPDGDETVYDGSQGGSYTQSQLDSDLENAHGMMIAYNACLMANGYMNEILLEQGGGVSLGSYTSVSFTGSGWWWNVFTHLVTHEGYTVGEAATYATARVSNLFVLAKAPDYTLRYVVYGDPNCPFVQTNWTSPIPAPINTNYGGHKPDKPANELAGDVIPDTIQINTLTPVTVTLLDTSGIGVKGVLVTIQGWGVYLFDSTDSEGEVVFEVMAPYGELLSVTAEKEKFDTFQDTIWVTGGVDFSSADISASVVEIGLVDTLTPWYEGTITGTTDQAEFDLYARGCGVDTNTISSGTSVDLIVVPTSTGGLRSAIAKTGFNIYAQSIPVIPIYGSLSGAVFDAITHLPVADVVVVGYVAGSDTSTTSPVFTVVTNQSGVYTVPFELAVGEYDIYVSWFGYEPFNETKLVLYGANIYDILLNPAPYGLVYGWVKESDTMNPLFATLKVYRSDNLELYTEVNTDSSTGEYEVNLPYFNYKVRVTAYQHIPTNLWLTVDGDSIERNFELEPTIGNVLVVNDDDGSKSSEYKVDKQRKTLDGWQDKDLKVGESAQLIAQLLTDVGYNVDIVQSAETDLTTWFNYDFITWSCGKDLNPGSDPSYRSNLISWVENGGKLLIEGGEITYRWWDEDVFARKVLHSLDWAGDNSGDLNLMASQGNHPIANIPSPLPSAIGITYTSYGDQDASSPASDAYTVYDCTDHPAHAGILVYDDNEAPQSGQIIFYSFNFTALSDTNVRKSLLQNTANFLLAEEIPPNCWISGWVDLVGASDSGVVVTANFETYSYSDTTGLDGNYLISLYPGLYSLVAHKDGYKDSTLSGVLTVEGEITEDVNFALHPFVIIYSQNFDTSNGEFSHTGDWQWGVSSSGPSSAHSAPNLWATVLDTNYSDYSDSKLETPEFIMPYGLTEPMLSFWHWYDTESNCDGGNVKISVNNSSWEIIDPTIPYPGEAVVPENEGIPGERCYSGHSQKFWEKVSFDLSSYVTSGDSFRLRFHFGSDGSVTYPGWYIDDFTVSGVNYYPEIGVIHGSVLDFETALPLQNTIVAAKEHKDTTDANGEYWIEVRPDTYTVTATLLGYNPDSVSGVAVAADETVRVDFALTHPGIEVEPLSFVFHSTPGSVLDTSMVISNPGNGELTYEIDIAFLSKSRKRRRDYFYPHLGYIWLTVEPTSGTVEPGASDSISLHFNAYGLSNDSTYMATVSISNNSANSPVDVPVSMTINPSYICGDCNGDGIFTGADATYIVTYVYRGGPAPFGSGDVNLDGKITGADATYIIGYIYRSGSPPCSPPPLFLDDDRIEIK